MCCYATITGGLKPSTMLHCTCAVLHPHYTARVLQLHLYRRHELDLEELVYTDIDFGNAKHVRVVLEENQRVVQAVRRYLKHGELPPRRPRPGVAARAHPSGTGHASQWAFGLGGGMGGWGDFGGDAWGDDGGMPGVGQGKGRAGAEGPGGAGPPLDPVEYIQRQQAHMQRMQEQVKEHQQVIQAKLQSHLTGLVTMASKNMGKQQEDPAATQQLLLGQAAQLGSLLSTLVQMGQLGGALGQAPMVVIHPSTGAAPAAPTAAPAAGAAAPTDLPSPAAAQQKQPSLVDSLLQSIAADREAAAAVAAAAASNAAAAAAAAGSNKPPEAGAAAGAAAAASQAAGGEAQGALDAGAAGEAAGAAAAAAAAKPSEPELDLFALPNLMKAAACLVASATAMQASVCAARMRA